MSKKYYWLKLEKDFFKRHDIRIVESMPNGKDYVLFYLKLILESMNHEGRLRFSETIPYNDDMLATITSTNVDIVRSAVKVFSELGLMEVWDDQTIFLAETSKMVGSETEWAKKKREYKKRMEVNVTPTELPNAYPYKLGECVVHSNDRIEMPNGTIRYVDEQKYSGNGKIVLAKSAGKCDQCRNSDDSLLIHSKNKYSNNVNDLIVLCSECYKKEQTGGQSPSCFLEVSDKSLDIELDIELYKDNVDSNESTAINKYDKVPYFNEFWNKYPKKVGKGQALTPFKNKVKDEETFRLIMDDLERRKRFNGWIKDNGAFIPNASTYLRGDRWLDEYETNDKKESENKNKTSYNDVFGG